MSTAEFIENNFDVDGLRENGIITTEKTTDEIAERICFLLGYKTIFQFRDEIYIEPIADLSTFSTN